MNEQELIARLRRIEALLAGASTVGERSAADAAAARIRSRIREIETAERSSRRPRHWSGPVIAALLRRYGVERRRDDSLTIATVIGGTSSRFFNETLWPEFCRFSASLQEHLSAVARGMIADAIQNESLSSEVAPKAG